MKLGTNDIGSVYLGTNAVQKVYLGTNEVWTSFTGLLDTYTGAAAAYSLRLLRSAYTGDAIRVRRASDNTEQDIGFVNGELDTSSLTTFCSGTNGFVKTWYDQSGNGYDATQTTASYQPQIVSGGSVITENGKPSVHFDGSDDYLPLLNTATDGSNPLNVNGDLLCSIVLRSLSNSSAYIFNNYQGSGAFNGKHILFHQDPSAGVTLTFETSYDDNVNPTTLVSTDQNQVQTLLTNIRDKGNTDTLYINSISNVTNTDITTGDVLANVSWVIGARAISTTQEVYNGKIQELILYSSDQSSNRTGIETNINDFYSIYYVATNSEYQDVLDYADSQGYQRPSYAQCALQDALVGDLKDAGIWSKLDTFAVFATDGDSDFALIDWIRLTDYTAFNSPTFTLNEGFEGDGSSAYINTNYTFNTDFVNPSQNDQSVFVYHFKDNAPLNNLSLMLNLNSPQIQINPRNPGNSYAMRLASGSNNVDTYIQVTGLQSLSRNNSSNYNYYIDGTNQVTITSSSVSYTTSDMVLLGIPSIRFFTNPAISMVGYGAYLDSTENSDLYTAWNNYYTAL